MTCPLALAPLPPPRVLGLPPAHPAGARSRYGRGGRRRAAVGRPRRQLARGGDRAPGRRGAHRSRGGGAARRQRGRVPVAAVERHAAHEDLNRRWQVSAPPLSPSRAHTPPPSLRPSGIIVMTSASMGVQSPSLHNFAI